MREPTPNPLPLLLEDGSRLDWPDARYRPDVQVGVRRATVEHKLTGADPLNRLLEEGKAAWAVELRCPKTLMARIETSADAQQIAGWEHEEVHGDIHVIPGVIALRALSLDGARLSTLWKHLPAVQVPPGWWLARGVPRRASTRMESLLQFMRNDKLEPGRMEVGPDYGGGQLRFLVKMAPDIFDEARSNRSLRVAALIGACGWFPRIFGAGGEEDRANPLARVLRDRLNEKNPGMPLWDDDNYDPALVATVLEPLLANPALGRTTTDDVIGRIGNAFSRWQRGIVSKGVKRGMVMEPAVAGVQKSQSDLEAAVAGGHRTLGRYLRDSLALAPADEIAALPFPRPRLTPGEFKDPPVELEVELGEAWDNLSPRLASQPVFWLLCHVKWIEEGRFGNSGYRLRETLTLGGRDRDIDGRTRNFLRRTGGLPHVRGNTSVFSDAPLARAWWRYRLAGQVARDTGGRVSRDDAHRALHANRQAWEELVMLSLRRVVAINQSRARAFVVSRLHEALNSKQKITKSMVQKLVLDLAPRGLRRSFDHTPWEELARL